MTLETGKPRRGSSNVNLLQTGSAWLSQRIAAEDIEALASSDPRGFAYAAFTIGHRLVALRDVKKNLRKRAVNLRGADDH